MSELDHSLGSPHKSVIQNDFELGDYEQLKAVGKGGSSTVYKGLLKKTDTVVAIKQIDTEGISGDQVLNIKMEIDTIKTLAHEHIVCYLGTLKISKPSKILIFLEYADRGSLRQFYQRKGALSEPQTANCTRQLLAGLEYLHGNGIAHRDIKCANCLLTKEGVVKLADFGASKRFETDSVISGLKGTPHWMAPEVIKGTQMTTGWLKADVWSVGCTVVEMVTGKLPFSEYENPMAAMYKIANGEQPPLPGDVSSGVSKALKDFIAACCAVNPDERPDVSVLRSRPFPARNKSKKKGGGAAGKNSPTGGAGSLVPTPMGSTSNVLTSTTKHPTLISTPSEALTEPYTNPLTRENSLVTNLPLQLQQQQMPQQALGSGNGPSHSSSSASTSPAAVGVGNGVGLISTDGATTKESSWGSETHTQDDTGIDVGILTGGGVREGCGVDSSTLTSHGVVDLTHTGTGGGMTDEPVAGRGGEVASYTGDEDEDEDDEEADELYLDDFEEGDTADSETDARVECHAPSGGIGDIAGDIASPVHPKGGPVLEGEFTFADMIAADEARKREQAHTAAAKGKGEKGGEGCGGSSSSSSSSSRVEYAPSSQARTEQLKQRPDNRPSRARPSGARASSRPADLSVVIGGGGGGRDNDYGHDDDIDVSPPLSATLKAGHGRPLPFPGTAGEDQHRNMKSEIDAQLAHTRSIVAEVALLDRGRDSTEDTALRTSMDSLGSQDTLNMQQQRHCPTLRPSPSSEVYLEQPAAPSSSLSPDVSGGGGGGGESSAYPQPHPHPHQRPQAPLAGDMRRVMGSYEEQKELAVAGQHNQNLRNSTSSVRSSVSTPGSAGSGGSGGVVVDSELLSRASSGGSASVRREALEALESGVLGELPRFDHQQHQHGDLQGRPWNAGGGGRSRSKSGGGSLAPGVRSQSANAAGQAASVLGASSMRLPPMGGTLAPLSVLVPEQADAISSGVGGMGIAAQGTAGIGLSQPRLSRGGSTNAEGNPASSISIIANPNVPSAFVARPIHSAPSMVTRGGLLAKVGNEGDGALPPLQSLTPKIKESKRGLGRPLGELHKSK